ncbi:MAG: PIG-L family deacetylase [Bryobacteraceae bacterium]|nr:PIG-L family deacetylase [Bryobacteraceae bacterium]
MRRRRFFGASAAGGLTLGGAGGLASPSAMQTAKERPSALPPGVTPSAYTVPHSEYGAATTPDYFVYANDLVIERNRPGKPHKGKVLAAVQAHSDDIPIFCGGTVAKLIDEGYTGYLIRLSNDESGPVGNRGPNWTLGHGVLLSQKDNDAVAEALGCKKAFSLGYQNHRLDEDALIEIRGRLIFLFRLLQVDTVVCYDPYNDYEENPDHTVMSHAVQGACWMASEERDYPEHFKLLGFEPKGVREKYYVARAAHGHNTINRVVDISSYIDAKVRSNVAYKDKGSAGDAGLRLRRALAKQGKKLPLLGDDDDSANFNYVKHFMMDDNRVFGAQFGLEYAEAFHYLGPSDSRPNPRESRQKYIDAHAVPL